MTVRRLLIALLPALCAAAPPAEWTPPDPKRVPYRTLTDGEMGFEEIIVSRDGKFVAGGGRDRAIRLWSLESGKLLRVFGERTECTGRTMVFTRDGRQLVVVNAWLTTAKDGTTVERGVTTWYDTATGKEVRRIEGLDRCVTPLEVSPDGKHLLARREKETDVLRVLEADTGREVRKIEMPRELTGAAYFRDGKILAVLQGNEVWRYDSKSGKGELLFGPDPAVQSLRILAVTHDGDLIGRVPEGTIRIRLPEGKVAWTVRRGGEPGTFAFRNKPLVMTWEGRVVVTLDGKTGRHVRECMPREPRMFFGAMAVSSDERWLLLTASRGCGVAVYDLWAW